MDMDGQDPNDNQSQPEQNGMDDMEDGDRDVGGGGAAAASIPTERRQRGPRDRELPQVQEIDESGEMVKQRFGTFLNEFALVIEGGGGDTEGDFSQPSGASHSQAGGAVRHYLEAAARLADPAEDGAAHRALPVDLAHVAQFDGELAEALQLEFYRFEPFLRAALRDLMAARFPDEAVDPDSGEPRDWFLSFYNLPLVEKVRDLRTDRVGRLTAFSGTVTRTTDVRPELLEATFHCGKCALEYARVEQQFQYTVPPLCRNPHCDNTNHWELDLEKSRLADWQRLRVQENADELPAGSVPRSVDVVLRGPAVERAKAGDRAVFSGTLVVVPDTSQLARAGEAAALARPTPGRTMGGATGLKRLGVRELTYRTAFVACAVQPTEQVVGQHNIRADDPGAGDVAAELTPEERGEVARMARAPNLYEKMVDSIAPTIFGHKEIKRGILLMLFGGVHKQTPEGIKLRGDINVCIVGDPSTSKSQFLKYVHGFLPRAIYTSGKASSAAGLTAAVQRDPDTGEFCVEAGALMLADNGICCIDEFDKMDPADQVAIHEAMEQQTISITKAGIQATLNARTSILAAANPLFGRYDRHRTLKANVQISAPIMSRFDLFFVVLDECDEVADYNVADHILAVHRGRDRALAPPFRTDQLQRYIRFARAFKPRIGEAGHKALVECYRLLREGDSLGQHRAAYRITVRQLESLVRLAEALARAHLDDEVKPKYVKEAYRLLKQSIIRVEAEDVRLDDDDEEEEAGMGEEEEEEEGERLGEEGGGEGQNGVHSSQNQSDQQQQSGSTGAEHEAPDEEENASSRQNGKPLPSEPDDALEKKDAAEVRRLSTNYAQLATHLRKLEENYNNNREGEPGLSRKALVDWYLQEHEDQLGNEEELHQMARLINQVITRLIKKDNVFIINHGEGQENINSDSVVIQVHPNYEMG